MNINSPIFLGLAGGAATGKTTTADALAPVARFLSIDDPNSVFWTHLFFAMPLYRMAVIRTKIQGEDAFDRQCFELHEALNDLFKGWITYEDTVESVYEIASMNIPTDGTKPRTFLQQVGTEICRSFDPDCFTKWVNRKALEEYRQFQYDWDQMVADAMTSKWKQFGVVVSDARFLNECQYIKNQPNGILIKFTASPEIVAERIYRRDGIIMTLEQQQHKSEQELNTVPDDLYDAIINTDTLSPKEQIQLVKNIVEERLPHA